MLRKIQDIAPILAQLFIDFEADESIHLRYKELLKNNYIKLGQYSKYIGKLHDSWIISSKLKDNIFSIKLNDFTTHVFADAINELKNLKIEHDKLVFPLLIEFKLNNISFNMVDDNGIINEINPVSLKDYLYEHIISVSEQRIEVGLVAGNFNAKNRYRQILILIDAKEINITERQEIAWKEIFTDKYTNYYEIFKSQLALGRYLSDFSECRELVEEIDKMALLIQ